MPLYNLEQFNKMLKHHIGEIYVRPKKSARFLSKMSTFSFGPISILSNCATPLLLHAKPTPHYYDILLPFNTPIVISHGKHSFDVPTHQMYIYTPSHSMSLDTPSSRPNGGLVVRFNTREFEQDHYIPFYIEHLKNNIINTSTQAGHQFFRTIVQTWSFLKSQPQPLTEAVRNEAEIRLSCAFINWFDSCWINRTMDISKKHLNIAEEYLNSRLKSDVSRLDLEAETGISIRSVSRLFQKYHGQGPMEYLKQRRLDNSYRELFKENRKSSSVSKVALDHKLKHLGKFSIQYKRAFGESPSTTLISTNANLHNNR